MPVQLCRSRFPRLSDLQKWHRSSAIKGGSHRQVRPADHDQGPARVRRDGELLSLVNPRHRRHHATPFLSPLRETEDPGLGSGQGCSFRYRQASTGGGYTFGIPISFKHHGANCRRIRHGGGSCHRATVQRGVVTAIILQQSTAACRKQI